MISSEILEYYALNYQNQKEGTNINLNKQLWIDFQVLCLELSRKRKKKVTPSAMIRYMMVEKIMQNKT